VIPKFAREPSLDHWRTSKSGHQRVLEDTMNAHVTTAAHPAGKLY
jgi:hypothetical protein